MKISRTFIVIISIIIILILVKIIFFPGSKKSPAAKGNADAPVSVTGFAVKPQRFESVIKTNGTIYANEEAELRAEIAGKIIMINFKEGGTVNEGDLLVKINDADLQANLRKQNAQLKLANDKLARQSKLVEIGGISREEYEMNQTELSNIQSDIDFTKAQIAKSQIHAPFSGNIGLKNISEGNYITQSTVIATIQQLNPVKIDFTVPEKYLSYLGKGSKIKFSTGESESGKEYEAEIAAIEPMIDPATRSVKIRARASNDDKTLYPGAFVHVELTVNISDKAILIPTESIVPVLKGKKVYVSRSGVVEEIKIETGERTEDKVEVLTGISAGDTVLTTGVLQVKKGSKIKFTEVK
ncbi:MAG: efflux RND transporter periplasmic adaptor subunit [Bacteroidia bacterium]